MSYQSNETLLLKYLGASPILRIIDFFLDNPLSDYSKNEVVKSLGMGRVTFFKYWRELEKSGAVKVTRRVGRATMYRLDRESEVVKQLIRLDMALARTTMKTAVEEVVGLAGLDMVKRAEKEKKVVLKDVKLGLSA